MPAAAAGPRRSGQIIHPSNHILDPDNTIGLSVGNANSGKQKAAQTLTRNVKSKLSNLVDNFDTSEDEDDNHRSTDVNEGQETEDAVDADEEYETLKAMADADHKVSTVQLCPRVLS